MIKRRKHIVPALNTTSTADISFMLLIFFLVASSMDVDKGLLRQLPPADTKEEPLEVDVSKERLMELKITGDNQLLLDGQPVEVNGLRNRVAEFVSRVGSKHLISIDADPNSSYETYFKMQNEIVVAYAMVRNELAKRKFGQPLSRLTNEKRDEVKALLPQRIAEIYHSPLTKEP
ncbi:MAG: biopolymer transporter ExbD [Prevotella sp.]|jgi:biopolymer transport protein ExbD|nr:biopolymer transporter ExbD [Prevotella sp.]